MKKAILASALFLAFVVGASGALQAQCYGSLALSSSFAEFDYLVRLAVHFGDASSIPDDIICSRSMLPSELVIDVPLWAYNLHEGAGYLEFSVVSNESIAVFVPDNCWSVVGSCRCKCGARIPPRSRAPGVRELLRSGADRLRPGRSRQGERSGLDRSEAEQPDGQDDRDRRLREIA